MIIILTEKQRLQIKEHTLKWYPKEMCGFLTLDEFIPCENIATVDNAFKMKREDIASYLSSAIAIVHSHCQLLNKPSLFDIRTPSSKDVESQKITNIPWLIVGCEGIGVSEPLQIPRIPNNNYIGRRFLWFVNDCYTLVQDWYRFELGIILKDYVLEKDYTEVRNMDDIFSPYIEDYNFKEISMKEIRKGDLLLLDNAGFRRNHLGIFDGVNVLHQDQLSCIVPITDFYGHINKVLRYVG